MPPSLQKEFKIKKKDRKSLTFDFKLQVLKRLESGVHRTSVAREFGLAESTVRYIVKNADIIKEHFSVSSTSIQPQRYYARVSIYAALEKHLFVWIEEMTANKMAPITATMIKNEAKRAFQDLKKSHKGPEKFTASMGWYAKFERTAKERNFDITGKTTQIVSVDFPTKFNRCIESNHYSPQSVFCICTTTFFWKRLPKCVAMLESSYSVSQGMSSNSQINLLLGCNAAGECLLPQLAVYQADDFIAKLDPIETQVPIVWRTSADGKVTKELFKDWYLNHFCPFVKSYCIKNKIDQKALLLLDDSFSYCSDIRSLQTDLRTEVLFVPKDVEQPLNRGAIATFKFMYIHKVLEWLLHDSGISPHDLPLVSGRLASYNVAEAFRLISSMWMKMEPSVMNGVWRELWPAAVVWTSSVDSDKDAIVGSIVDKINSLSWGNTTKNELESLLSSQPLEHESTLEMSKTDTVENNMFSEDEDGLEDDDHSEVLPLSDDLVSEREDEKILTSDIIENALSHVDTALNLLLQYDNDSERIASVKKAVTDSVSCYRNILDSQRITPKQNTIYGFLKSVTNKLPPSQGTE